MESEFTLVLETSWVLGSFRKRAQEKFAVFVVVDCYTAGNTCSSK